MSLIFFKNYFIKTIFDKNDTKKVVGFVVLFEGQQKNGMLATINQCKVYIDALIDQEQSSNNHRITTNKMPSP